MWKHSRNFVLITGIVLTIFLQPSSQNLTAAVYALSCEKSSSYLYYCGSGMSYDDEANDEQTKSILLPPVNNPIYTALFHEYPDEATAHRGIDLIGGREIIPAKDGIVVETCRIGCAGSYGNYIIIKHGAELFTLYGHLAEVRVNTGQEVFRQADNTTILGIMGNTGYSFGTHLHFEVRKAQSHAYEHRLDPVAYLKIPLNSCNNMYGLHDALLSSVHKYRQWYGVDSEGVIYCR